MAASQLQVEVSGLELVHEMGARLVRAADLQTLLDLLVEAAITVTSADKGVLHLRRKDSEDLEIKAQKGFGTRALAAGDFLPNRSAIDRGDRVVCGNIATDEALKGTEAAAVLSAAGVRAFQATPFLSLSGSLLGVLTTYYLKEREATDLELRLLDLLVRQGVAMIERILLEEARRESERRYRSLMELLPAAVYTCEAPSGIIQYYNRHAALLWGREPAGGDTDQRFCGSFRLYRTDGTSLPHDETPMASVLRGGPAVRNQEVVIERPDGSRITVAVNIDPLLSPEGRLIGAINAFRDVTEQRQHEQQQAQLAAIVESSTDAIISKSLDGVIRSWNAGAVQIFGYTEAEAIGRPITMIIPPERLHEEVNILERIRRGERVEHFETVRVTKHGRRLDVSLTISPMRDRSGRVTGASKIGRDITERERNRRDLEAANAALVRSNTDLEQFAHSASHDLQEPLRMILLYSDVLTHEFGGQIPAQAEEYVQKVVVSAKRLERLLRDLRSYVEVTVPGTAPTEPADGGAALAAVLGDLAAVIEAAQATITSEPLPTVGIDAMHLEQLFQNLLGNGIKYRSEAPPRIHISATRHANQWLFEVRDNGIGVAPEYTQSIFEMFKRLHGRDRYEGTGMGLAICKRIVERYGGKIWVESGAGGSKFFFTVPAVN